MAAALQLCHVKRGSWPRVIRAEAAALTLAKRRAPTGCPDSTADLDLKPVPGLNHVFPLPADGTCAGAPAGGADHAGESGRPDSDRRGHRDEGRRNDRRAKTRRTPWQNSRRTEARRGNAHDLSERERTGAFGSGRRCEAPSRAQGQARCHGEAEHSTGWGEQS